MTSPFSVVTVPRFDRQAKALRRKHPRVFTRVFAQALAILQVDPYNQRRDHPIRKLKDRPDGQYRLRLRRFRFRYDVEARTVVLKRCGLRREDTYKG